MVCDFYMDDFSVGADTLEAGIQSRNGLIEVLGLRYWVEITEMGFK